MKDGKKPTITRRQSIGLIAGGASFLATQPILTLPSQEADRQLIALDLTPRFELSPYLYMQFMEPLGATDGSVEAAWDHFREAWGEDVVETTRELEPTMLRWAESLSISSAGARAWGQRQTADDAQPNVGRHRVEPDRHRGVCDFSRRVRAEPLICVNFESDGREQYVKYKGNVAPAMPGKRPMGAVLQRPRQRPGRAHGHSPAPL